MMKNRVNKLLIVLFTCILTGGIGCLFGLFILFQSIWVFAIMFPLTLHGVLTTEWVGASVGLALGIKLIQSLFRDS